MATHLTVTATHDGTVENSDIRDALRGIDPDDLSQSSPIDRPARLSTARDGDQWVIRSGERGEEFTQTTTDAISSAIAAVDGVTEIDIDGGYEAPSDTDEDADGGDDGENDDDDDGSEG